MQQSFLEGTGFTVEWKRTNSVMVIISFHFIVSQPKSDVYEAIAWRCRNVTQNMQQDVYIYSYIYICIYIIQL